MFSMQRTRYRIHSILILGICLLLLSSVPPQTAKAGTVPLTINNGVLANGTEDFPFKNGQFQRTALVDYLRTNTNDFLQDTRGGVQLGPVGLIKGWKRDLFRLPFDETLYSMGATAIGNRIFIIGGHRTTKSGVIDIRPLAEVWSVGISTLDGALLNPGWQQEASLPAVQGSNFNTGDIDLTGPVAEIESPAVTSISTDASGLNGYIYVIGGNARPSPTSIVDYSSYAVRIGSVKNGHIAPSDWSVGAPIPSPDPNNPFLQYGLQQAQAVTVKVGNDTYVYVIGGLQRKTDNFGNTTSWGVKTVFYARVGAGGKLLNPDTNAEGWKRAQDLPVSNQAEVAGLWDASAVADTFVGSNQTTAPAIYVVGGQVTPTAQESGQPGIPVSYSEKVYRALINGDGSLSWSTEQGGLPAPRSQATAAAFRGNIYMAGGVVNGGAAEDVMLTSYVENDLTLHLFTNPPPGIGGQGTNFLVSNIDDHVLTVTRKQHATALVSVGANSPNSAFLYVLGGIGSDAPNGANTILYGKIGGGEDVTTTGYASDGWYYGQPYDVAQTFSTVELKEVNWTTTMTTTDMDIALDFRLSKSADCANVTSWSTDWQPLDGAAAPDAHFSITGGNRSVIIPTPTLPDLSARCFQYRARLSTSNALSTPLLLNVSVLVKVPGGPDINKKDLSVQRGLNDAFLGLSAVIQNVNTFEPTLDAKYGSRTPTIGTFSFFVDLCIFGPGQPIVPPTLPFTSTPPACSTVYANVNVKYLPAGASYTIPQWLDSQTNQSVALRDKFKTLGTYTVYMAIDSTDYVDEGLKGGEGNNLPDPITFDVTKVGVQINLPLIHR